MAVIITGVKELDRKLQRLKTSAVKRIVRSALSKQSRVVARYIKAAVPGQYKDAKKTVGSRLEKIKLAGNISAKAGFSVGKTRSKAKPKARRKGKGVGIARQNVHWLALGTKPRRHASGKSTGTMPDVLHGVIASATRSAAAEAQKVMFDGVHVGLEREARRK